MKVLMTPPPSAFGDGEGGIRRVIEAYHKYMPEFGIEYVDGNATSYDLKAVHAGTSEGADVAHNHGLYWTADLDLSEAEWISNIAVIHSLREAKQITVPSQWVAETIRRDMRIDPHVIGHGIEWDQWQGGASGSYVLWNKNRPVDVCSPEALLKLGVIFPKQLFLSTFGDDPTPNVKVTGQVPFPQMRQMVLNCAIYLSSVKETFGIGVLEAMAAGKPILGWANGGNMDLVQHGVNGYLAQPDNYEDLAQGLDYCLRNGRVLGENGREMAKEHTWQRVCEQVARVYELAYKQSSAPSSVGVVIPVYNKSETEVVRAIESCLNQSYQPDAIVIMNDGSPDRTGFDAAKAKFDHYENVFFREQPNQGVADARNNVILNLKTSFVVCLDADDWLEPAFVETCITALEKEPAIGIAYTRLQWHNHQSGESVLSDWPEIYDAAKQFNYEKRGNQIPSCCLFRRDAWARVGGYRSRYCPNGAGSEDAAFWSQILSIGYTAKLASTEGLFNYSIGGEVSGDPAYNEIDWLAWLPFSRDKRYPFACSVKPRFHSHPVHQYDTPDVSIVIPVGPGHEDDLRTALDSIEAQHFRNWEVIVVMDTGGDVYYPELTAAYPYVKWLSTGKADPQGPGVARNIGAEKSLGHFLLFLDADDFFNPAEPHALGSMIEAHWRTGDGIYSAHIGRATVSPEYAAEMEKEARLLAWNEHLQQAYILNHGVEYDCALAVREPGSDPNAIYIWGLITTLIPRQWHFDIGGFDESMPTWEDWDYWIRMAKMGRCFTRLKGAFVIYNYISGTRREIGRQNWADVLQYLREKHKGIPIMACGCGSTKTGAEIVTEASGHIMATYIWPNKGRHDVGFGLGRHVGGGVDTFLVPEDVARNNPHKFQVATQQQGALVDPPAEKISPAGVDTPPPAPIFQSPDKGMSWTAAPIVDSDPDDADLSAFGVFIKKQLSDAGLTTKSKIASVGAVGLTKLKGIGPATAKKILETVK